MRWHLSRTAGAALAGVAAALVAAPSASANTFTAGPLVQVPDRPLAAPGACQAMIDAGTLEGSVNFPGSEVEPMIAADPADPQRLVAAFQQDRWNDGGGNGDVSVVSTNGGASWMLSTVQAPFSICTGGQLQRTSDPALAFSSNGATVYQAALAFDSDRSRSAGTGAIEVSTSTDGGMTWNAPKVVKMDNSTRTENDKEWITADPTNPAKAYIVWDRIESLEPDTNPSESEDEPVITGPAWFSKTSDSGASWSQPRVIYNPGLYHQTIDNEILAPTAGPATGDLLDGFVRTQFTTRGKVEDIGMVRSGDGGATWSSPTIIARITPGLARSLTGAKYRTADDIPQFAADPSTGALYVTWQDGRSDPARRPKIFFSRSTTGGVTWSQPIEIDQAPLPAQAFTPQIAVNSAGTIGVSYYDSEKANPTNPGFVDEYIVHCHAASANCDDAASWSAGGETRLSTSGSFNMTTAPGSNLGYFTGDYEGLAASGLTFDAFFAMAQPVATAGPTDVFSTTAQ